MNMMTPDDVDPIYAHEPPEEEGLDEPESEVLPDLCHVCNGAGVRFGYERNFRCSACRGTGEVRSIASRSQSTQPSGSKYKSNSAALGIGITVLQQCRQKR